MSVGTWTTGISPNNLPVTINNGATSGNTFTSIQNNIVHPWDEEYEVADEILVAWQKHHGTYVSPHGKIISFSSDGLLMTDNSGLISFTDPEPVTCFNNGCDWEMWLAGGSLRLGVPDDKVPNRFIRWLQTKFMGIEWHHGKKE